MSSTFERGFVTYTDESECELLGIEPSAIARYGVVSREIALAMATGALARSHADVALGVTGFAGKAGPRDEAGLVHLAVVRRGARAILRECHFGQADRDMVRTRVAAAALEMVGEMIAGAPDDAR